MKNYRWDFRDNEPVEDILEVLSGSFVLTYSAISITYDLKTGNIISILVTADNKTTAKLLVKDAAKQHLGNSLFKKD